MILLPCFFRIAVPGMVDNFQKQWEALKVPYPKDTLSSQIEQQAAQEKTNYEKFVSESKTRIQGINQVRICGEMEKNALLKKIFASSAQIS